MSFLTAIWLVSLAFAALSLVLMTAVVFNRIRVTRAAHRRTQWADQFSTLLFASIDGDEESRQALCEFPADGALVARVAGKLLDLLRGESRQQLVRLLGELNAVSRLSELIRAGNISDRLAAIRVLGLIASSEDASGPARRTLYELLDRPERTIRTIALDELVSIEPNLPVASILNALRIGNERPSKMMLSMFRRLQDRQPELVVQIAAGRFDRGIRIAAIAALGHSGRYDQVDMLAEQAADSDPEIRGTAIRALADLGHPAASDAVRRALEDGEWQVRAQGARAAWRLGLSELIPMLVALLSDEIWWVRFRAAEALAKLGEPGLTELRVAATSSGRLGRIAHMMLSERGAR